MTPLKTKRFGLLFIRGALNTVCLIMVKERGRTESAITITAYMSLVMAPLALGPAMFLAMFSAMFYWVWTGWEKFAWLIVVGVLDGAMIFTSVAFIAYREHARRRMN